MVSLPGRPRGAKPREFNALSAQRCDRCPSAAQVRVAKHIAVLHEYEGQPHAVDSSELDLVFCVSHFGMYRAGLSEQGWRWVEGVGR